MENDKLVDFDHVTDYISREAVLALETDLHFDGIEQLKHWRCHHIDPTAVEILPAADVRPVVRGRWEPGETVFFCGVEYAAQRTCSVCGRSALDEPWYFCPNCGADMREVTP